MNLGQLIAALKKMTKTNRLMIASPTRIEPVGITSYRGFYSDLAIEFAPVKYLYDTKNMSVGRFLPILQDAVGEKFPGYKGGMYRMDKKTKVWISNYREVSNALVNGIQQDDDIIYLTYEMNWKG